MTDETNLPVARKSTEVAAPQTHEEIMAFLAEQEKTDDFTAGDKVVPWLVLVQSSGDFMKRGKPNYNPEAREGDITDNLTRKLRSHQSVILCKFEVHYSTWKPKGGKLVKQWFTDASGWNAAKYPEGKTFGNKVDADGNEVRQSNVYYILAVDLDTGVFTPMVWSLSSTQFGKAKKINSLATEMMTNPLTGNPFIPPIYARLFDLTSGIEHGGPDGDKSWAGWIYNVGDAVLTHKYGMLWTKAAIAFRKEIEAGNVRPAAPEQSEGYADDGQDDEQPRAARRQTSRDSAPDDEQIPF